MTHPSGKPISLREALGWGMAQDPQTIPYQLADALRLALDVVEAAEAECGDHKHRLTPTCDVCKAVAAFRTAYPRGES